MLCNSAVYLVASLQTFLIFLRKRAEGCHVEPVVTGGVKLAGITGDQQEWPSSRPVCASSSKYLRRLPTEPPFQGRSDPSSGANDLVDDIVVGI
jgi:hypothetical protein